MARAAAMMSMKIWCRTLGFNGPLFRPVRRLRISLSRVLSTTRLPLSFFQLSDPFGQVEPPVDQLQNGVINTVDLLTNIADVGGQLAVRGFFAVSHGSFTLPVLMNYGLVPFACHLQWPSKPIINQGPGRMFSTALKIKSRGFLVCPRLRLSV